MLKRIYDEPSIKVQVAIIHNSKELKREKDLTHKLHHVTNYNS